MRNLLFIAVLIIILPLRILAGDADQPEGGIASAPNDMMLSGSLWLSDTRWELDFPFDIFSWNSPSLGVSVQTTCDYRLRRSVDLAHAVVLLGCQGFPPQKAIVWIILDTGGALWGSYDGGVTGAIRDANIMFSVLHVATHADVDPAGKLVVWDGTFEADNQQRLQSWGELKSKIR